MRVESKSKPESIGRIIAKSSIGWTMSTALVLTEWRAAAVLCGLYEGVVNKFGDFYYGIRGKVDEIQFRRTKGLNQKGKYG